MIDIKTRRSMVGLMALCLYSALLSTIHANTLKPGKELQPTAFELQDLDGQLLALDDYSGQVVLVNFWATWCPPCVKELPSMQRLEQKLSDRPFKLIAINIGEDPDEIKEFLRRINVELTVVVDNNGTVSRDWGLFAYPTSFLLNKEGVISHTVRGEVDWDNTEVVTLIESLMSEVAGVTE